MKKAIRFFLPLMISALAFTFVGCDDDEDKDKNDGDDNGTSLTANKFEGTVEGVGSAVDEVRFEGYYYDEDEDEEYSFELAKSEFKNNKFSLKLPSSIDSKYLYGFSEHELEMLTISNPSAKTFGDAWIHCYKENELVGYLEYTNLSLEEFNSDESIEGEAYGMLIYVDRDVTITGESTWNDDGDVYVDKYDCALKKGWNIMVEIFVEKSDEKSVWKYTTKLPAGMKWIFDPYDYSKSAEIPAFKSRMKR